LNRLKLKIHLMQENLGQSIEPLSHIHINIKKINRMVWIKIHGRKLVEKN